MEDLTKEDGEISDDSSVITISEISDTEYRDMLLSYFEENCQSSEHILNLSSCFIVDDIAYDDRKGLLNLRERDRDSWNADSPDDDLYELELRRDALASVPVDADCQMRIASDNCFAHSDAHTRTDKVDCQTNPNKLLWKSVPCDEEQQSLLSALTFARSVSARKEFCEFIQNAQSHDFLNAFSSWTSCDNDPNSGCSENDKCKRADEDNYDEVEMDLDSSRSGNSPCREHLSSVPKINALEDKQLTVSQEVDTENQVIDKPDWTCCHFSESNSTELQDSAAITNSSSLHCCEQRRREDYCDNDAGCATSMSPKLLEQKPNSYNEDDTLDEMEALILRDQLLRSITMQHQKQGPDTKLVQIPVHKPVVISLNEDSTDSENESAAKFISCVDHSPATSAKLLCSPSNISEVTPRTTREANCFHNQRLMHRLLSGIPCVRPDVVQQASTPQHVAECNNEQQPLRLGDVDYTQSAQTSDGFVRKNIRQLQKKFSISILFEKKQLEKWKSEILCLSEKMKQKVSQLQSVKIQRDQLQKQLAIVKNAYNCYVKELSALQAQGLLAQKNVAACRKRMKVFHSQLLNMKRHASYSEVSNQQPSATENERPSATYCDIPSCDSFPIEYIKPYKSSLLCFKAYRFNPYYRLKETLSLSSETFSNKFDCQTPLCQFELLGKCFDEACPWQHQKDYSVTPRELLTDLVSYYPVVAGVFDSTCDSGTLIAKYVDAFIRQHGTNMQLSDQCLLLIDQLCAAVSLVTPHRILTESRRWRMTSTRIPRQNNGARSECRSIKNNNGTVLLPVQTDHDVRID